MFYKYKTHKVIIIPNDYCYHSYFPIHCEKENIELYTFFSSYIKLSTSVLPVHLHQEITNILTRTWYMII